MGCDVRQAVWKEILPGDSRAAPSDNVEARLFYALNVHGLQCFGDTLKIDLLECSLSCGLERYPMSSGLG